MIQRIGLVAARDFMATVSSKGFLVGLLVMPVLILMFIVLGPRIANSHGPRVSGQVEVMDPTGLVIPALSAALEPQAIARRRQDEGPARPFSRRPTASSSTEFIPQLSVVERPAADDVDQETQWLTRRVDPGVAHLALVVVKPDAVVPAAGHSGYGGYDLYLAAHLDQATEATLRDGMREALIAARLKHGGIDRQAVESAMRIADPTVTVVTPSGRQPERGAFARALPFACGILLFVGIISGGQILMTSTVEEKSSRIVEVLLSAVSPVELMAGKLLAQLGVGLAIMGVYLALSVLVLSVYSLAGMLDPMLIVYLVVFYLLAYLVYGGLMLAIGAAVNQVAEAQSLMGPVMILLVAPYVLVPMIGMAPNSSLSVAMSFVPPVNAFAILARLASTTPPPLWQVFGSMLAGLAGAVVAVWFAAKIFRIGLLMHGKPPNLATLIRWARMA